jgi:hypothetical protein
MRAGFNNDSLILEIISANKQDSPASSTILEDSDTLVLPFFVLSKQYLNCGLARGPIRRACLLSVASVMSASWTNKQPLFSDFICFIIYFTRPRGERIQVDHCVYTYSSQQGEVGGCSFTNLSSPAVPSLSLVATVSFSCCMALALMLARMRLAFAFWHCCLTCRRATKPC